MPENEVNEYPPFDLRIIKNGYIIMYKAPDKPDFFQREIIKEQMSRGFGQVASRFTHVEIAGVYNPLINVRYSINITLPKCKLIDIKKEHAGRYIRVCRYDNDEWQKVGRMKTSWLAATKCNLPYDVTGILRLKLHWLFKASKINPFCSEGCAESMQTLYPDFLGGLDPKDCLPAHYYQLPVVWEGLIP